MLPPVIDFSPPFLYNVLTGLVYDHPMTEALNVWVFTKVFGPEVWLCSAITVILLVVSFIFGVMVIKSLNSLHFVSSIFVLFSIPLASEELQVVSIPFFILLF